MSSITDTALLTKPINAMFMRRFLSRAAYETHYFAGSLPANVARQGGTATALWHRYEHSTPTTTPLAELSTDAFPTRPPQQPTRTDITKAVSKYGAHFTLNEEVEIFNFNGTTAQLMDVLASQAGRSVNMVQRNEMEDNSTLVYANGASSGAVNTIISTADVESVINTLSRNVAREFAPMTTGSQNIGTVPILRAYWGITHPDVARDISQFDGFISVKEYAGQIETVPGEFGAYESAGAAVRFIKSPDASIDEGAGAAGTNDVRGGNGASADSADLYTTVIYGEEAYGSLGLGEDFTTSVTPVSSTAQIGNITMHVKSLGSAGAADPLDELMSMGWKAWAAAKVLNANWCRGIRSAASIIS